MIGPLRHIGQTMWRMVLCGFLLFASLATPAQTIAGTTILDNWRSSFDKQLDDEMWRLASVHRVEMISSPGMEQTEQNNPFSQANAFSGLAYRGTGHSLTVIRAVLQSQGLPASLIGVAAVESGFNPIALSPKGAAGLWQFMPGTARQYGLVVNANQDDRLDVFKSTMAAAHYLRVLHDQFGDWPLALAAYNAGPNRVGQGLDRFNARDFWTLSRNFALPEETRSYVLRVITAMGGVLASQNLELGRSRNWNPTEEAPDPHSINREGKVVFATTSSEASIPENAK